MDLHDNRSKKNDNAETMRSRKQTMSSPLHVHMSLGEDEEAHDKKSLLVSPSSTIGRISSTTSTRLSMKKEFLIAGMIWFVFFFLMDAPFGLHWMYVNGMILRAAFHYQHHLLPFSSLSSNQRYPKTVTKSNVLLSISVFVVLYLNYGLYVILEDVELKNVQKYPIDPQFFHEILDTHSTDEPEKKASALRKVEKSASFGLAGEPVLFFRMYNPQLDYTKSIERIESFMNDEKKSNSSGHSQGMLHLPVPPSIGVWESDVYRYDFLTAYLEANTKSQYGCLIESDVVVDMAYIAQILLENPTTELAHNQHFWGHRTFEPYNIGLLCVKNHPSARTKAWIKLMAYLHQRRYRRLLILDFFFLLVPNHFVFLWDLHHGCTDLYPHCRYIHFTSPKKNGIDAALEYIQTQKKEKSRTNRSIGR